MRRVQSQEGVVGRNESGGSEVEERESGENSGERRKSGGSGVERRELVRREGRESGNVGERERNNSWMTSPDLVPL